MNTFCIRKSHILSCICFCICFSAISQTNRELNDSLREVAKVKISQLKNGILLVRLFSNQDQIDYYSKNSNFKAAEELSTKTQKLNQYLVNGIRSSFHFCPVYFFEDSYTRDVIAGNFAKVLFYNDVLIKDSTIRLPARKLCFVAEYSFTKSDTNNDDHYYESSNLGVPALVVMDEKLNQLKRPFPYYCKFSSGLLNPKKIKIKISKWDVKLENYYSQNNK